MTVDRVRRAAKPHWCVGCWEESIEPGDLHLVQIAFPGEEGVEEATRPWRTRECRSCAERYGRGHLFPKAGCRNGC